MIDQTEYKVVGNPGNNILWLEGWLNESIQIKEVSEEDILLFREKHPDIIDFVPAITDDVIRAITEWAKVIGQDIKLHKGNYNYCLATSKPRLIEFGEHKVLAHIGSVYDISRPTNETFIWGYGWIANEKVQEIKELLIERGKKRHFIGMV